MVNASFMFGTGVERVAFFILLKVCLLTLSMKGLTNLGNTCYFNCALQCLLQTPILSNYFIKHPYVGECKFTMEYSAFVKKYWTDGETKVENPKMLLQSFRKKFKQFDNCQEQDAQEALMCILDILEHSVPNVKSMFYGTLDKQVIYPGGKSITQEKFGPLMLMPESQGTLTSMIDKHFGDTVIEGYQDDNGKTYNVAVMKQSISSRPPILLFSINMFIRKYAIEVPLEYNGYSLYACSIHMGSVRSGHYISFTKHKGKWYLKDDTMLKQVEAPPTKAPFYICMYKEGC